MPRRSKVNDQWIEKVEPLAGRDSFLTLAHRTGKFAGIESKVEIKETKGGTIMEKLSNKGLVTIILGALMMGSVVVQCVSHIIDAILIF
mgnify:CR=1 FL=1